MCEFVTAVVRVGEGYMQFVCLAGPCAPQVGVREVGRAARERVPRADWTHTSTTHSPGPLQHGAPNRPPGSVPLLQCALPAALLPRSRPGPAWVQPEPAPPCPAACAGVPWGGAGRPAAPGAGARLGSCCAALITAVTASWILRPPAASFLLGAGFRGLPLCISV